MNALAGIMRGGGMPPMSGMSGMPSMSGMSGIPSGVMGGDPMPHMILAHLAGQMEKGNPGMMRKNLLVHILRGAMQ